MTNYYLHGLGQGIDSWNGIAEGIDGGNRKCIDLASLCSGKIASYSVLHDSLAKLLSEDDGIVLCGLSLGAVLALDYEIENPDRVRGLVLIAPQYRMPRTLLRIQNSIFRLMPEKAFDSFGFRKKDFMEICSSMIELDFTDRVRDIKCPVLIAVGERDNANRKPAIELSHMIESSELCIVMGAGHEVNMDAKAELSAIIEGFISRL